MIAGILIGTYITIAILTALGCMLFNILGDERNWLLISLLGGVLWPITWLYVFNLR
jgi:hypothetical protein